MHGTQLGKGGAAAFIVEISYGIKEMIFAGGGNVMARCLGPVGGRIFTGENGTLGDSVRKITEERNPWDMRSVLVVHSDDISSRWDLEKYPGLIDCHPAVIATVLHWDFRKKQDDSCVVVVRQR